MRDATTLWDIDHASPNLRSLVPILRYFFIYTVKPVLSGHPRDPRYSPLNTGVRLIQVRFTENKGRKIGLYRGWCPLNAGCPLNTGFTVFFSTQIKPVVRGAWQKKGKKEMPDIITLLSVTFLVM